MIVTERVYHDATRTRFLPHGHPEAAFLAHAAGDEVGELNADETGLRAYLMGRRAAPAVPVEDRKDRQPQDKMVRRPATKGRPVAGGQESTT